MTTSAATRSTQLYCGAQGLSNFENTKCVDDHPKTRAATVDIVNPVRAEYGSKHLAHQLPARIVLQQVWLGALTRLFHAHAC
jgi:hypothetical protein